MGYMIEITHDKHEGYKHHAKKALEHLEHLYKCITECDEEFEHRYGSGRGASRMNYRFDEYRPEYERYEDRRGRY